jgi:O-6-methylguanine DNA methyltransferase
MTQEHLPEEHDTAYRPVLEGLRTLRVDPPESLLPAVLVRTGLRDGYAEVASEIGPMFVAFRVGREVLRQPPPPWLATALERRDAASLRRLPVDLASRSAFQQAVLAKAREIPRGEVRPYGWIAREIGRPGAVRAVGSALGDNPVPWLVPCHRVVRSDGQVGDYALGPQAKHDLLAAEGADPDGLERLARRGVRYVGSDTTGVYCYPTCRHARRITEAHRVHFRDAGRAGEAGFRPCTACRPEAVAA